MASARVVGSGGVVVWRAELLVAGMGGWLMNDMVTW